MHPLIEWLKTKQQTEGFTDEQFAKRLGYPNRTSWTMHKLGERTGPTFQLLRGALVAFPMEWEQILSLVVAVPKVPGGGMIEAVDISRAVARG